jgi:hypothetical protein
MSDDYEDHSQEEIWAGPRLDYLNQLIAEARKGQFPKGDHLKEIDGLNVYIVKGLPGSDKIRAKLVELRSILENKDNDDDEIDRAQKTLNDEPLFGEEYAQRQEIPIISDPKGAFAYFNSFCWAYKSSTFAIIIYDRDRDKYIVTDQTNFERMYQELRLLRTDDVTGKSKRFPITEFWLKGPHRFCTEIVFHPGLKVSDDIVNLWRNFKTKPKAGRCKRLLFHIRHVLCGSNPEHYEYLRTISPIWFKGREISQGLHW